MAFVPAATIVRGEGYKILGREEGETSTFFLFGLFPLTNPLNIEYAMSQAVQKIDGGQSLVNVGIWHETHYYYPIGTVSVLKVEGDVVNFSSVDRPLFEDKEKKGSKVKIGNLPKTNSGGLTVGGKKKKSGGGGITVGGTK
ncbi:MAG: hypothetical protein H7A25_21265 [Leptospiraceae bacterium]|nr:hypothetical protein [Leptospiraceae bacterium]MCP5502441.1 hypothetical protein [Leptospiraceae bacterium]